jgi:ribosomal protein S18 acetylase RimI-like enzyme
MSIDVDISPMRREQWRELRALRLEMLADSPTAYVESLAAAQLVTDEVWQERAVRYTAAGSLNLVAAERGSGHWVGTMSCYVDPGSGRAYVVAVYVAPSHRGRAVGVADVLLDGVESWAVAQGMAELWLEVHESNHRAQAFYLRRGYALTGQTRPYDLDPATDELEMRKALAGQPGQPGQPGPAM